jgi:predicted dehydrogenase
VLNNINRQRYPLRGALIGFGNVAVNAHLPLWKEDGHFRIEAIVDPQPERIELARVLLPDAEVHRDYESLIRSEKFDFVDICTPPCFHAELVLKACRAGMHVFCEKPLLTSCDRLPEIQEAAERTGHVIFTVNNWKHAPLWTKVFELIGEGKIGSVRSVSLAVLRPPQSGGGATDWRRCAEIAGGGILLDHGWHHLYLILSIVQAVPLCLAAKMGNPEGDPSSVEQAVDLTLKFPRAEAHLHLTWQASSRQNRGTIEGDRGILSIDDDHLILNSDGLPAVRYDFEEPLSKGSHHREWMRPVIADFRRELEEGGARGTNLRESGLCARLIHLAYRSHREGSRPIHVGDLTV